MGEYGEMDVNGLLAKTAAQAASYLTGVAERPVASPVDRADLLSRLGGPVPQVGADPVSIIDDLVAATDPGLVGSAGPRYFGFVVGGALPSTVAADWLTSTWDQNAGGYVLSPAAAVVEDVAASWVLELLGLPSTATVGFTTGCTMAHFICLAAARSHVLQSAGWDVERQGLFGAPPIEVIVGAERHVSLILALRYVGLGSERVRVVPVDEQGRMEADAFAAAIAECKGRPIIVCLQAGNVDSGSFDPVADIIEIGHRYGAWVHVDGAFGLWAAASEQRRHLVHGVAAADSWATDAHKWLNVPYDSGLAIVADRQAHLNAMSLLDASYLMLGVGSERDNSNFVPEMSRRARGFAVWAAIRELGATGVSELVDRCCDHARRFAAELGAEPGVEILNDVVLNQVLVRFLSSDGDHDARTREVVARVQADGTCWLGGTTWHGTAAMRISVSNWRTTQSDVDRSVQAILRAAGIR